MEQHDLFLPFFDLVISKDLEINEIWMDIFYKKQVPVDVFCLHHNIQNIVIQTSRLHDCNRTRTHNHLVHKQTLNHLAKFLFTN